MGKSEGMLLNNGYEYFADYNENIVFTEENINF